MTPREFKAWFEGFTEGMDGKPTAEQWERVKKRVAEIDGKTVTEKVYVDRYLPDPWRRRWYERDLHVTCSARSRDEPTMVWSHGRGESFEPMRAMALLGRADAASLHA